MVRVVFGTGLPREGATRVPALTLGEAIDVLVQREPWLAEHDVRWFVDGVDAELLEGDQTPIGDEDTVLVWHTASARQQHETQA